MKYGTPALRNSVLAALLALACTAVLGLLALVVES